MAEREGFEPSIAL